MKKIFIVFAALVSVLFMSCTAEGQFEREAYNAKYKSTYATTVNKLEREEGDFKVYRRVIFYNVRLGQIVFACEGYLHVQTDRDGDIELVVKDNSGNYLRHYLGQKQDITYFSEQLESSVIPTDYKYTIQFNPNLWVPKLEIK